MFCKPSWIGYCVVHCKVFCRPNCVSKNIFSIEFQTTALFLSSNFLSLFAKLIQYKEFFIHLQCFCDDRPLSGSVPDNWFSLILTHSNLMYLIRDRFWQWIKINYDIWKAGLNAKKVKKGSVILQFLFIIVSEVVGTYILQNAIRFCMEISYVDCLSFVDQQTT